MGSRMWNTIQVVIITNSAKYEITVEPTIIKNVKPTGGGRLRVLRLHWVKILPQGMVEAGLNVSIMWKVNFDNPRLNQPNPLD